ncbi:MAG: hypothetical protein B6D61_14210 [Bacteroidetes bacterium 4484_249]|nr:MAG: hypothetical protein B6D61_14210 [Bacteroidetes bacterium 4484_249]
MKNTYYKIPLDFQGFFPAETAEDQNIKPSSLVIKKTQSLAKSVDEFIEIIITTHYGEYRNDNKFGFNIWEIEFENIQIEKFNTHNYPKEYLEKSLKSTIEKYEPRLKNVEVEILFIFSKLFKKKKIKYFVDITVRGILANNTSDKYSKSFQFAMGPFFK